MHYVDEGACVGSVRASVCQWRHEWIVFNANIHCHAHSVSSKRVSEISLVNVRSIDLC